MNFISSNIKHLRVAKGITQEELANVVNKSRVLISQWESDSREITTEDIIKLSDFFNIPMDTLVGKDLRNNNEKNIDEIDRLYNKAKPYLSPESEETIKFILNKTIENYEENKKR